MYRLHCQKKYKVLYVHNLFMFSESTLLRNLDTLYTVKVSASFNGNKWIYYMQFKFINAKTLFSKFLFKQSIYYNVCMYACISLLQWDNLSETFNVHGEVQRKKQRAAEYLWMYREKASVPLIKFLSPDVSSSRYVHTYTKP